MENWLWIFILMFFLFRLLMRAKKSRLRDSRMAPSGGEEEAEIEEEGKDPLRELLERLSGVPPARPTVPPAPTIEPVPPTPEPPPITPKPPPAEPAPPPPIIETPVSALPVEIEKAISPLRELEFSVHPLVQGIIFSEILGPPQSERRGAGLHSD